MGSQISPDEESLGPLKRQAWSQIMIFLRFVKAVFDTNVLIAAFLAYSDASRHPIPIHSATPSGGE